MSNTRAECALPLAASRKTGQGIGLLWRIARGGAAMLAVARGKKMHDKRETEKERDWKREQGRLLRNHG